MKTIRGLCALPCLLLAACQVTTFEKAPIAASPGCDPALAGRWIAADEGGEVELVVGPDCTLSVAERENDGWKVPPKPPTTLHVGRHGDRNYGWVDATWGLMVADEADRVLPEGDVVVLRYRIEGDRLLVWGADDKAIAHRIVDGDLQGRTQVDGSDIINRLSGDQPAEVLEERSFFEAEPEIFLRRGDR
jgi:hypothetical protein